LIGNWHLVVKFFIFFALERWSGASCVNSVRRSAEPVFSNSAILPPEAKFQNGIPYFSRLKVAANLPVMKKEAS
jgi:hypothetical protein